MQSHSYWYASFATLEGRREALLHICEFVSLLCAMLRVEMCNQSLPKPEIFREAVPA